MASVKKIRDEIMTMTIVVNSNPAQQEIYKLTQKSRELTNESKSLNKEREKVAQTLGEESQEYKDLTQKISDNSAALKINNNQVKELTDNLDLNEMTVKQLRNELKLLNRELNDRVAPGTEQYNALQQRIKEVRDRMKEVRQGGADSSDSIEKLNDTFNEYAGTVAVVVGTLAAFAVTVQEVIDRNNEMADAMSAVEKTTGMTSAEVQRLADEYVRFDTRTKKIDLLKIAEVGGRLGVAKSEILDFTREVDKAYVALGDSWKGGVDDLADSLGRIASLYKETKDLPIAESINQVGSALNELAAQGASSEQNIADFVNRLGSMPPAMKPALNTLLGFGSALEESGINAEIGASGFSKFVRVASANTSGFAKIMREPVAQVKEMINSDPAAFFLKFSEGLRGLDATQVQAVLEELKLNDNEVQRVIGAATEKTERFRESVELANGAVADGTSLTNEFAKVNNNAAAIYEKVTKKFSESLTSLSIAKFLEGAVTAFGQFIGVIEDGNGAMTWYRNTLLTLVKIIIIATTAFIGMNLVIGTYNTLLKDAYARVLGLTVVEKARNLITATSNALTTLYTASLLLLSAGYNFVTGNTVRATAAMRLFNVTMAANPVGAVVALVTILASAYFLLSDNTAKATEEMKALNFESNLSKKVTDEQANSVGELKSKIEPLISVLKDEKSQLSDRKKAYEELIKIHPEFKGTLDAEYRATDKLTTVYDSLIAKIKEAAKVRALQALLDEEYKKREKLQAQTEMVEETRDGINPSTTATINGKKVELKGATTPANEGKMQLFNKLADGFNDKLKESDANIDSIVKKMATAPVEEKSKYNVPDPEGDKAAKDAEKLRKQQEAEAKRQERLRLQHEKEIDDIKKRGETAQALQTKIQIDIEDAEINAMKDGYEKEIALINIQEKRKIAEIDKAKIGETEINVLQRKIDKASDEDKKLFSALMESWKKNNADLEKVKVQEQAVYETKRQSLRAKFEVEELKDIEDHYQRELNLVTREKNEELAQYENLAQLKAGLRGRISSDEMNHIRTWNDGKEALTKVYQKKEIDLHIAHLQGMISLYEGLDLTILNKDQREQVIKFLDDATNKIAELKAKAQDNAQGKNDLKNKNKLGQGQTDILGMSVDDWQTFFNNIQTGTDKLGTLSAAVGLLQQAFSAYYSYVQANEQAQLRDVDRTAKRKEARLKKMLDSGQINQEQYEAAVQRLNQETEMNKYQLELDAAKRQKKFQIGQAIASTAMAIMNIWATTKNPVIAAALSLVVGAIGAVQVATIAKQPLPEAPGYEDGYGMSYDMKREQDGKSYNVVRKPLKSGPVYRPTHFIAGEGNKMEMVIDNKTYRGFSPAFRKALNSEIAYSRGASGYEGGHYPYLENRKANDQSGNMEEVISNNTAVMNELKNKTFRAYVVKDMETAKTVIEMTEEFNSYKNQAKKN